MTRRDGKDSSSQFRPTASSQLRPTASSQLGPTAASRLSPTAASRLSPTARVILGMIALGNRTGYDIKRVVDKSTRHFWAASYGQIYPELGRLERAGLVRGRPQPSGGRARTVYELTKRGSDALRGWLRSEEEPTFELRDEGMLKLFFSDTLPDERVENVRAMRERHERKLAELRSLEQNAGQMHTGPSMTLELGIAYAQWLIDWCEATERRLASETYKE
jgi:PadR family transcriptional regulator, regulatory protein AphA